MGAVALALLALLARFLLETPARGPASVPRPPLRLEPPPSLEVAAGSARQPVEERVEAPSNESASAPARDGRLTVRLVRGPTSRIELEGTVLALDGGERRKRVVHADAGGTGVFAGLPARTWTLTVYQAGYRPIEREFVSDGTEQELELALEGLWTVEVFLFTPSGEPLAPALRAAGLEFPQPFASVQRPGAVWPAVHGIGSEKVGAANWFEHGPFHDEEQPGRHGALVIDAAPPAYAGLALGEHILRVQELVGGETSVRWTIAPDELAALHARVRGRLVGDGSELAGYVNAGDPYGSSTSAHILVGTDGNFELRLAPGAYRLYFDVHGFPRWSELVQLVAGETLDLGERRLDEDRRRIARVLGPEGEPLAANFRIGLLQAGRQELAWSPYYWLQSYASGHLELPTLGTQRLFLQGFVMRGTEPLASALIELGTSADPRSVSEIRLARAAPLLFRAAGLPPGAKVDLCTQPGGLRFFVAELERRYADRLPPGDYLALVRDAQGVELARRVFTLGPEGLELSF